MNIAEILSQDIKLSNLKIQNIKSFEDFSKYLEETTHDFTFPKIDKIIDFLKKLPNDYQEKIIKFLKGINEFKDIKNLDDSLKVIKTNPEAIVALKKHLKIDFEKLFKSIKNKNIEEIILDTLLKEKLPQENISLIKENYTNIKIKNFINENISKEKNLKKTLSKNENLLKDIENIVNKNILKEARKNLEKILKNILNNTLNKNLTKEKKDILVKDIEKFLNNASNDISKEINKNIKKALNDIVLGKLKKYLDKININSNEKIEYSLSKDIEKFVKNISKEISKQILKINNSKEVRKESDLINLLKELPDKDKENIIKFLKNKDEFKDIKNLNDLLEIAKNNPKILNYLTKNLQTFLYPKVNAKTISEKMNKNAKLTKEESNLKQDTNDIQKINSNTSILTFDILKDNNLTQELHLKVAVSKLKKPSLETNMEIKTIQDLIDFANKKDLNLKKISFTTPKLDTSYFIKEKAKNKIQTAQTFILNNQFSRPTIINAKQTLTHFANNLEKIINNYKPPVSKLSVELHPKELGKVEVTLIQRGDNLKIQINSQPHTIQFFNNHQQDLKNILINMGYSDVNMSFNSNSNSQQQKKYYKNQQLLKEEEEEFSIEIPYFYA